MSLPNYLKHVTEIGNQFSNELADALELFKKKQFKSENEFRLFTLRNLGLLKSVAELNLFMRNISKNWEVIFKIMYIEKKIPFALAKFYNLTLWREQNGIYVMEQVGMFDYEIEIVDENDVISFSMTHHQLMEDFARDNMGLIQMNLNQQNGLLDSFSGNIVQTKKVEAKEIVEPIQLKEVLKDDGLLIHDFLSELFVGKKAIKKIIVWESLKKLSCIKDAGFARGIPMKILNSCPGKKVNGSVLSKFNKHGVGKHKDEIKALCESIQNEIDKKKVNRRKND